MLIHTLSLICYKNTTTFGNLLMVPNSSCESITRLYDADKGNKLLEAKFFEYTRLLYNLLIRNR